MTVTPTGLPTHSRASDITTFGGDVNKKNYLDIGKTDPLTDVAAEEFSRMVEVVQCVEKTAPFAVLTYRQLDGYSPTLTYFNGFYAEPPLLTRISDGYVNVVFGPSYSDTYGVAASFAISNFDVTVQGIYVTAPVVQADISSGTQLLIKVTGATGGPTVMVRIW